MHQYHPATSEDFARQIALHAVDRSAEDDFTCSTEETDDTWTFAFSRNGRGNRDGYQVLVSKSTLRVLDCCRLR